MATRAREQKNRKLKREATEKRIVLDKLTKKRYPQGAPKHVTECIARVRAWLDAYDGGNGK